MNAYNIISYLRRGYFIFPSGVFEKRLCEVAKNNKPTSQEDTEKCRRLIEYAFGEGKFPKEYIKGFEHINLDDEEDVNEFAQTLAVDTNVSVKASPEEKLQKLIDKIFDLNRAGCEGHFERVHSEGEKNKKSIVISKDEDNIFAQNTPVCLKKVVVFRPTWPPQDCSYKDPTGYVGNVQDISNNYTRYNEKKNKKEEENNVHHEILATTTILEDNYPPISLDHRVMIEPHIDIYADEEEDLILLQNADRNVEMAESEQEHMRFNLIVYSQEKTESVERNSTILEYQDDNTKYTSEPVETEHSQNSSTISPHHDINIESKNMTKIDPVEVDTTGLEKVILNSLINKTVGPENPFPYQVKWETCESEMSDMTNFLGSSEETCETETIRETAYIATAKLQLREEIINLDPPTVETIARFDTLMPEKSSIPYCTTHNPNTGEHGEIWNEQSANAKVHLEPPTIENISRLDCLVKETINLDPPEVKVASKFDPLSVKTKKPETKVVWKDSETIMEPVTPKQKRWLDVTNPRPKPKTIRLNPLKVENISEEKEESQKPENWKDFEKIAVPIPSSQETSMPNFAKIGTKFIESKECTITTLKEKIKPHNITKKQIDDLVKTDFRSNPEERDRTLHMDSETRQLREDHEKDANTIKAAEENRAPTSGDVMQVEKSYSKIVFASHPQIKSNLIVSRETPSMHLKDLIMQVISRQPYNEENEHDSSVTQNESVNIENVQNLSNKDQAAITELSQCRTCKTEKHSSQAEKRERESQHEEIRPLDLNDKTVNNDIKPASAETINKAKIEDMDEEEDYVGAYIFPTENIRKNHANSTETIKGTEKIDFTVTVVKMNNKVNEDSPLITTDKKPIQDIKVKIENKANVLETSLKPEYNPKNRSEMLQTCKKEHSVIPQQNAYSYFPSQCCHYVNCHNFYQQNDPRYVIGLAAKYRHYYPCYQTYTNQDYGFYGPLEPYTNQTYAFYKTSINRPKNTIRKAGIATKTHKHANHSQESDIKSVVSSRANIEMDKHKQVNNSQESDIKTVVSTRANDEMDKHKQPNNSKESDTKTVASIRTSNEMDKQKQANNFINTVISARGNNEMEKHSKADNSQESEKNTIVSTRANKETDKHSNYSLKSDIKTILSNQINVEMDKHTEAKKMDIIKTLVSTRASHEMDMHTYVKIPQVQTITSAELDLSKKRRRTQGKQVDLTKIPTKLIQGKGNMRTRAEHVLKNRMPIETSVQRQVRLRTKPKLENEILDDKPEPSDLLEKDLPLSVLLERVRERNRKEQVLKNLRLIEGEQKTTKSGRDKSPPTPTCPPPEPPRSSPPMSLPPSGDNVPKFCPPKRKDSSKFFEMLSTLSVYDNDNPSERSITSGKRRQLEKRLLGDVGVGVGINRWIFVQDKALPWSDSETENMLECSRQSIDEHDVKNLWYKNIF